MDKIKINDKGRCVSANCIYSESDRIVEKEYYDEKERTEFLCNLQNYIYVNGEFVYDPISTSEEYVKSDAEIALEMALELDYRMSLLELERG